MAFETLKNPSFLVFVYLVFSFGLVYRTSCCAATVVAPQHAMHPRTYTARPVPGPVESMLELINGDVEKPVWMGVPWSEAFGDIQGKDAPLDDRPIQHVPWTSFKALYDTHHLYLAGILHPLNRSHDCGASECPPMPTEAHFTQRNEPIYQQDSDFEVFVDLDGTTHDYKELEVNALNTVWNLLLDKPYSDGGREHSGRVATNASDPLYYEVHHQKTATRVVKGRLNDDTTLEGALWTVEVALAWSDLMASSSLPTHFRPLPGSLLRINFSRVEKKGLINWTWQPQYKWDPESRQWNGVVDMHQPDSWGYLQLGHDDGTSNEVVMDPYWPVRRAAAMIYYAQQYHKSHTDCYARSLDDLILDPDALPSSFVVELVGNEATFVAIVVDTETGRSARIRQDRYLTVDTVPVTTASS